MKTYCKCLVALTIFFFVCPFEVCAQSANEAIMALKKLQAKCDAGTNYTTYGPAVGDAKFPVSLYLESNTAKENPALSSAIELAMSNYELAGQVWSNKMSGGSMGGVMHFTIIRNNPLVRSILDIYPDLNKSTSEGGLIRQFNGDDVIYMDSLVAVLMRKANESLKLAAAMSTKNENGKTDEVTILKRENERLRQENENLKKTIARMKKKG